MNSKALVEGQAGEGARPNHRIRLRIPKPRGENRRTVEDGPVKYLREHTTRSGDFEGKAIESDIRGRVEHDDKVNIERLTDLRVADVRQLGEPHLVACEDLAHGLERPPRVKRGEGHPRAHRKKRLPCDAVLWNHGHEGEQSDFHNGAVAFDRRCDDAATDGIAQVGVVATREKEAVLAVLTEKLMLGGLEIRSSVAERIRVPAHRREVRRG